MHYEECLVSVSFQWLDTVDKNGLNQYSPS